MRYGVLANVAVDYFRLISRHGNTVNKCFKLLCITPLKLLENIPNFVDKQLYVKGICDQAGENIGHIHTKFVQFFEL